MEENTDQKARQEVNHNFSGEMYGYGGEMPTLHEMFERYIEGRSELKERTLDNYHYMYTHYVKDVLGYRKISELKYSEIRKFYNDLSKQGLCAGTIANINVFLHPVFTMAVRDELIRQNPTDGLLKEIKKKQPSRIKKRMALTAKEQERLLSFVRSSRCYRKWLNMLTVYFGTGGRIAELTGLQWDELDFDNDIIKINHNCNYRCRRNGRERFYMTSAKSASGIREIPMFEDVKKALYDERERQRQRGVCSEVLYDDENNQYNSFVFTNRAGKPFTPSSINAMLDRIVKACNKEELENAAREGREPVLVPKLSAHRLRHSFCTRLCENEANMKAVQEIMGHADISTTMNVYAEVTLAKKKSVIKELEGKFVLS